MRASEKALFVDHLTPPTQWTVGSLRRLLEALDDDWPVWIDVSFSAHRADKVTLVLQAGHPAAKVLLG